MIDGILNVYKEKGYTSHDVVAKLRGILRQKKIGHTGTLDPEAEGVLPVCLGKATRLCDMLTDKTKTYRAGLLLGRETDTQDIWGQILKEQQVNGLTMDQDRVREIIMGFVGEYAQIPPMYSALKVNGKKLYDLAREGKVVERQPRQVFLYQIEIQSMELPRVSMTVCCSKGTYIRTLCHDIGVKLGCGGCMESLTRTQVDRFKIEDSLDLARIEELRDKGTLGEHIMPIEAMFSHYPSVTATREGDRFLHNGNPLKAHLAAMGQRESQEDQAERGIWEPGQDGACFRVYNSSGRFMGIYQWQQEQRRLKPQKIFFTNS